jgi:hypothetical protein
MTIPSIIAVIRKTWNKLDELILILHIKFELMLIISFISYIDYKNYPSFCIEIYFSQQLPNRF